MIATAGVLVLSLATFIYKLGFGPMAALILALLAITIWFADSGAAAVGLRNLSRYLVVAFAFPLILALAVVDLFRPGPLRTKRTPIVCVLIGTVLLVFSVPFLLILRGP